ncbi:MAG: DUF1816 domain-containing protein [Waterburya sp.]
MKTKNIALQQKLFSTEQSLEILRQNLSQSSAQPEGLSSSIKQLSLIKLELQSVSSILSQQNDDLISVFSHEFFTPLTLIQGYLQLLAAGKLGSDSALVQSLVQLVYQQTNKLRHIVNELLVYEQIKSGQLRIVPQHCRVADLLKQAVQTIQLKNKQVRIILSLKPKFVSVWADPLYTIMLLSHLLNNAIKFSPNRSIVTLTATLRGSGESESQKHDFDGQDSLNQDSFSTSVSMGFKSPFDIPEAHSVLFQVKDRGIGIPSDQLEKIFDCFYQIDRSDSRSYNGLGLGLALCHQIVQQHGGQVWAERTLRGGSTFYATLPVYPPAQHWWLEIQTKKPQCTYYFGPFDNAAEARALQDGYLEDLMAEQAQVIAAEIKQCQPKYLTICRENEI